MQRQPGVGWMVSVMLGKTKLLEFKLLLYKIICLYQQLMSHKVYLPTLFNFGSILEDAPLPPLIPPDVDDDF